MLVGTISIEKSEELSSMLKKKGIKHNVLNAKFHEKEAEIVAQAGKFGAVTVATNMAGRGTDIMLGGNAEYLAKAELRKACLLYTSNRLHKIITIMIFQNFSLENLMRFVGKTFNLNAMILENQSAGFYQFISMIFCFIYIQARCV